MADHDQIALVLGALVEIPARLAALEKAESETAAKLDAVLAALPPTLVTISAAATAFKVSEQTVRRWAKKGDIPSVKIKGKTLIDLSKFRGRDAAEIASLAEDARTSARERRTGSPCDFMSDKSDK